MKSLIKFIATTLLVVLPLTATAADYEYKIKGMHCGGCVKSIKAKVCNMEGIEKCEVAIGSLKISTKDPVVFTQEQIQDALSKAGEYIIEK